MRRISSHLVLLPEGLLSGRIVTISDEGVIVEVAECEHIDSQAGVEFYPGILVPGFVNAHCHLELSHMHGVIPPGGGFTAFARGMASAAAARRAAERRGKTAPFGESLPAAAAESGPSSAARFWDAKLWSEGVAAAGDVCNGATTFELKGRSRIKYHNFCELFGLGADPAKVFALRGEAIRGGLQASVTPHSTYSLASDAFRAVAGGADAIARETEAAVGRAKNDIAHPPAPLSIHFMESEAEAELFRRRGPLWEWYAQRGLAPDFLDYGSPAERLTAQVPATTPVMLIHNCVATRRDIDIVMGHFTASVTWVVCARSNRHISDLTPPIGLLRASGLRIAVGTDSLASNDDLSMMGELAALAALPDAPPLAELLRWATVGGAAALGMDDTLGTIEVGKSPGLVLLSAVDMQRGAFTEKSFAQRII